MERLNCGIIMLTPKLNGAKKIHQFRPICLLWCPYKLVTEVLDNNVAVFADKLISRYQNPFNKQEVLCMEFSRCMRSSITPMPKNTGIVLKLDFEKVYDKVNSDKKDPNK